MVRSKLLNTVILSAITIGLTGCIWGKQDKQPNTLNQFSDNLLQSIDGRDLISGQEAEVTIAEAAVSVSKSLSQLAEVERAVHPNATLPTPPNAVRIGMANQASVDWSGPVEALLRKVAKASHYDLKVLGVQPAIPIIVSITAQNTPLADILRDISFQADKQATVALYPKRHIIELRYLGA